MEELSYQISLPRNSKRVLLAPVAVTGAMDTSGFTLVGRMLALRQGGPGAFSR